MDTVLGGPAARRSRIYQLQLRPKAATKPTITKATRTTHLKAGENDFATILLRSSEAGF